MRYLGLLAAAALLVAADAPGAPTLDWMAGAWIEEKGDRWAEEYWTGARGGMLMGSARLGSGKTIESFEFMRIDRDADGTTAFFALPQGRAAVRFGLTAQDERSVVFENPANDYPKRIRYWRDGDLLRAEISGANGADAMRWAYRPM